MNPDIFQKHCEMQAWPLVGDAKTEALERIASALIHHVNRSDLTEAQTDYVDHWIEKVRNELFQAYQRLHRDTGFATRAEAGR
jgi:hypothetical protein